MYFTKNSKFMIFIAIMDINERLQVNHGNRYRRYMVFYVSIVVDSSFWLLERVLSLDENANQAKANLDFYVP